MAEFDNVFTIMPDDIPRLARPGIPDDYDLQKLLSNTMRNKEWVADFADATSRILYEEIEKQRKGLALSRSPEYIDRVFKILLAKQLGLDYKSDIISDADYDRIIDHISIHNLSKGPDYFIKFLGFIKNMKLDLVRLWTRNYLDFLPGIPTGQRSLIDPVNPGTLYPTSHVGVLYEEFFDDAYIDLVELEELFYKMAPINLVLKWIAAVVTLRIGTIYMGTGMVFEEHFELRPKLTNELELILSTQYVHEEYYTLRNYEVPTIKFSLDLNIRAVDIDYSTQHSTIPGAMWNPIKMPHEFKDWTHLRVSPQYITKKDGTRRAYPGSTKAPFLIDYTDQNNPGILFEPSRTNFIKFNNRFDRTPMWRGFGIKHNPRATVAVDQMGAYRIHDSNLSTKGYIEQTITDFVRGELCYSGLARRDTSRFVVLEVRVDNEPPLFIVADLQTNYLTVPEDSRFVKYGMDDWSHDWHRPWFSFVALDAQQVIIRFYPNWGNYTLEGNAAATPAAAFLEYLQLEKGDYPTSPIFTALLPRGRQHNRILLGENTVKSLNKPCGWLLVCTQIMTDQDKTLFEASFGPTLQDMLSVRVIENTTYLYLKTREGLQRFPAVGTPITPAPQTFPGPRNFAIRWDRINKNVTFFLKDYIGPQSLTFPSNFLQAVVGSGFDTEGTYSRLTDFRLFGLSSPSYLPSDAELLAMVS